MCSNINILCVILMCNIIVCGNESNINIIIIIILLM